MICKRCNDINQEDIKMGHLRYFWGAEWQKPIPICKRCRTHLRGLFKYYKKKCEPK